MTSSVQYNAAFVKADPFGGSAAAPVETTVVSAADQSSDDHGRALDAVTLSPEAVALLQQSGVASSSSAAPVAPSSESATYTKTGSVTENLYREAHATAKARWAGSAPLNRVLSTYRPALDLMSGKSEMDIRA